MLRIGRGMSQQQLADVIGTSQQSINKYENHNVEPDIYVLMKMADFFETSIDNLVGYVPHLNSDKTEGPDLCKDEIKVICAYRKLSKGEKESIRLILRNYLKNKETSEK